MPSYAYRKKRGINLARFHPVLDPLRPLLRFARNVFRRIGRIYKRWARNIAYSLGVLFHLSSSELNSFFHRLKNEPLRDLKFANRMRSAIPLNTALFWNIFSPQPLIIIFRNVDPSQFEQISKFTRDYRRRLRWVSACGFDSNGNLVWQNSGNKDIHISAAITTWPQLRNFVLQYFPRHDLVTINLEHAVPTVDELTILKFGAHNFYRDGLPGATTTGYTSGEHQIAGFDFSRTRENWEGSLRGNPDFGQQRIPRRTLVSIDAVNYFSHESISGTFLTSNIESDFESGLNEFIVGMNQAGRPLLCMPQISIALSKPTMPKLLPVHRQWLTNRKVTNAAGITKIIFVLPATSISGGIRVVMQIAQGLSDQGNDVEIWSLEGNPNWFDLSLNVKKFENYDDLGAALCHEDGFKVATWWETGNVVWEASINKGIPVNFVQEFETWFFPENLRIQAAVVASYRKEFAYIATGGYQQSELRDQNIDSTLIPVGYDSAIFSNQSLQRSPDTLLALGRSFFQKNFKMTLQAWRSIQEAKRPNLQLFGIEPSIATDSGISYVVRPDDNRVAQLYSTATCFVQTSYHEGFSLPLIEAMASGCPVITTNSHGNMDFCLPDVNCLLVEQDNPSELAEKILQLLSDESLQSKLSSNGLETAKKYSWDVLFVEYGKFFTGLKDELSKDQGKL